MTNLFAIESNHFGCPKMLFQVFNEPGTPTGIDLSTDNSDANNRTIMHRRGAGGESGSTEVTSVSAVACSTAGSGHSSKAVITKIPSMSEINYINYINSTRLGLATRSGAKIDAAPGIKSTVFAGLPSGTGVNDAAFVISSKEDVCNDPNSPTLYDILDKYYQACTTLSH